MTGECEVEIKEAFERAQKGHNNKAKLVAALKRSYIKVDKTLFHETFVHCLKHAMIVYKREPAVENVIEFAVKFATSFEAPVEEESVGEADEEENNFLNYLFHFLLESHNANSHAVRFRACQLINKLLGNMAENAQIDDDLFDLIHETMLIRVTDKYPNVRIQAALAMARLQEPQNEDCPTIKAYIAILENDSNPEVRRAVLSCIAPCAQTLPKILRRTSDVKENVRKLAYQVLADKVHIRALSIAQRVDLLQRGLNDTSEGVKDIVQKKLLPAWLKLLQGDVLELLHRLDVENCPETAVSALSAIFSISLPEDLLQDRIRLDERKLVPVENLTCENVLYWRALCEFIKAKGDEGEEMLEQILPEAVIFAEYLFSYLKSIPVLSEDQKSDFTQMEMFMTNEFIGQQLILLVGCVDTNEEGGRKRVLSVLQEMLVLPNTSTSLVSLLVEKLVTILRDDDRRIQVVAEIISDIREPILMVNIIDEKETRRKQVRLAEVKVKIFEAKQALEECIEAQEFSRASDLKNAITELESLKNQLAKDAEEAEMKEVRMEKNDPETLLKCLTVCAELLKQMSIKKDIGPTMNGIVESLILPGIACTHPAVRNMAVICLGTCALHSKDLANRHLVLLLQIAQLDEPKIRIGALKGIIDQLLLNGLGMMKEKELQPPEQMEMVEGEIQNQNGEADEAEEDQDTIKSILIMFTEFLDSEIPELRTETAEGLAKLMYTGRLSSAKLLSRLILLWYNPVTEDDTRLRHCLGVFFQLYSRASRANRECLEESFLPTLQTLLKAPTTSPLAEVDMSNVIELFVELTRPSDVVQPSKGTRVPEITVHDYLATRLCNEILEDPTAPEVRLYAKCLTMLELTREDCTSKTDLLLLLDEVVEHVHDKISLRAIEKVIAQLRDSTKDKADVPHMDVFTVPVSEQCDTVFSEMENEEMKMAQKTKRGANGNKNAKRAGRKHNCSNDSEEEENPMVPITRASRKAKIAALEKTKLDLTTLL